MAIILIKYKPSYEVSIDGEKLGYIENKKNFEESVKTNIIANNNKNIDAIDIKQNLEYELKLINRTLKTNEEQISNNIKENLIITYKYYEIALNNETIELVNTIEEAEDLLNNIKEKNAEELELSIKERYTQDAKEVRTTEIEIAKTSIQGKIEETLQKQKEQERINNLPDVNGIKLAVMPISGIITSRYGVSSSLRKSTHTGIDIAATTGTPVKVVADGIVTSASYNGSYGNLVKIDHGNGVETWYAHNSKICVKVGQMVNAGDTIAAVGSTGNSTGPHLHLEIRINGQHVNPQSYLYK